MKPIENIKENKYKTDSTDKNTYTFDLNTYKDVKSAIISKKGKTPTGPYYQALVEVANIFTNKNFTAEELAKRILIKQDLTSEMRKVIQDVILKYSPEFMNMVPYGTSASGDATGIANTGLGKAWYDKKGRTKMSDTGTGKGLPAQVKQGLNLTTFLAAILIVFPVCGFLPSLAALLDTDQDPKPTNDTLFPFLREPCTFPRNDSNAFLAAALVTPASPAIASIKSDLFIVCLN